MGIWLRTVKKRRADKRIHMMGRKRKKEKKMKNREKMRKGSNRSERRDSADILNACKKVDFVKTLVFI